MEKRPVERTSTTWQPIGGGEMGDLIRSYDWAATPLGQMETWPQSIRTAIELMLAMPQPVCLWWGEEPRLFYNDSYQTILGERHPHALGRTMAEVWPELVETFPHPVDAVRARGAQRLVDRDFVLGAEDERSRRWVTGTWTPIHDESGAVIGSFNVSTETTDRVLAERKLRESEERQAFLLQLSDALRPLDDPVEIQGMATRLLGERLGVSRAYYVEYDTETGISTVARDYVVDGSPSLVGQYDRETYRTVLERISDGRTWIVEDVTFDGDLTIEERELLASQGVIAWVDVPLVKHGQLVAVLCVVQATARRWTEAGVALVEAVAERTWAAVERARAEVALRGSEENFRSVANVVPDLLWYGEPDGSTAWYNERWMEYTGQTFEQAIGWGWVDAIHPDDRETSARRYYEAVEQCKPLQQEHRIRRHDGTYRWFLVRAQPLIDESGHVIRWYGAATNVDEARTARDELEARVAERTSQLAAALEDVRSSEERLRLLLQQVPAMLWATDRELRITTLLGADVPVQEVPGDGRTVDELFAEVDANGAATLHRQALAGKSAEFEFHIDSHTYEAHLEPLHDPDGQTIGTIGVAYDVTDRTLRRMQEDFIASVSHELQTPLTSVRAGLGLLDAAIGDTLGPAERELLSASRRNAERLRLEIGQLLAANQLTTSGPTVDRSLIALHGVVDDVARSLQTLAHEKDQTITVDMADRLEVEGDRRLLEQVLANLLSNAHRHTPPGTAITVSAWFVGNDVQLAVHDTGPGIPPDQLKAIFQRFYRSPGSRREGIGLGLAITRDAVEAQGGQVWAESVLGQGTTFFVSLPRARKTHST